VALKKKVERKPSTVAHVCHLSLQEDHEASVDCTLAQKKKKKNKGKEKTSLENFIEIFLITDFC
jgi:hypothetical protein